MKKLQEEAEIPKSVWQKADEAFRQIKDTDKREGAPIGAKRKRRSLGRKGIAIAILAATLMVSTLTVCAAAYFHWNSIFSEQYHVTPEMEQKLDDTNTAKELHQSTEHDGLKIEAVQSVADSNLAHIVLKVWGSDKFPFNDHMNFGNVAVKTDGNDNVSITSRFLDNMTAKDWSNGAVYEFMLQDTDGKGLLNKEITLTFTNVVDSYEGKVNGTDPPVLLNSTWELKLKLDNEDNGKVYEVNQQIPDSYAFVKQIRLSPVSFTLDMNWKYQTKQEPYRDENGNTGTFEHMVSPPMLIGLVYKDGSTSKDESNLNGYFTNKEKTEYRVLGYNFNLIDCENVSALIFNVNDQDVRVPVGESKPVQ